MTVIKEELSRSQWKKIHGQLESEEWKNRYSDWFGGKIRVFLDLDVSTSDPLYKSVNSALAKHKPMYKVLDWVGNKAINVEDPKSNRQPKITSLLNALGETDLLQKYARRATEKGDNLKVVICRHPYDIAAMSTGTSWTSCMNLDTGCYNEHVPLMIDDGALAAYVIDMNDPKNTKNGKPFLGNPLKRILAVPVTKNDDLDERGLWVVSSQYPKETPAIPEFKKIVEGWIYGKQGFTVNPSRWFIDTEVVYDDNYREIGKRKGVEEREEFKLELDEDGFVAWMLAEEFEDWNYLNRQPDEDEYDYYREEAEQNIEVNIYNYDRLIREAFDTYSHECSRTYNEVDDRMEWFVKSLANGNYDMVVDSARDAIQTWCENLDEKYEDDYIGASEDAKPEKSSYTNTDPDQYERDLRKWEQDIVEEFQRDFKTELKFIDHFMEKFPYNFKFETKQFARHIDHPDQLKLPFEGRVNIFTKLFSLFG
jgi:hypothetical protein